jgi:hypothetical protein
MKHLFIALLFIFNSAYAYDGHSIAGSVTLNGLLKSSITKTPIPLGGVSSFYGYEALNFPNSTPVYCYGGMGLSSSDSLIGINFGGSGGKVFTTGSCKKPEDYKGGFLSLGLSYDMKNKGSKSISALASFSLRFDLGLFNQEFSDGVLRPGDSKKIAQKRIRQVIWHMMKYAGRANQKTIGKNLLWLKVLLLPMSPALGVNWEDAVTEMKFVNQDIQDLKKWTVLKDLKTNLSHLFHDIQKDPKFYKCEGLDCEDIFVGSYKFMDAIVAAMGECHGYSVEVSATNSINFSLPLLSTKLHYSFNYSYYGIKKEETKDADSKWAALKAFGAHRFSKKSKSCEKIEEVAAGSFADFLILLGI